MDNCCTATPDCGMAEQKAKDDAILATEVEINGVKLRLSDMFPDAWGARDFYTKLNLLNKSKGGKKMLDTSPASIMDDDADGE